MASRPFARLAAWSGVLVLVVLAGARGAGPLPPLGPLLDPVHGIWGAAYSARLPPSAEAAIPGLSGPVRVVYDDRRVPHIFAATVPDAHRALGYVVARDRLFQMELQARATAGALSELLGASLVEADREVRRLGLAWAAERDMELMERRPERQPEVAEAVNAYADGVNAFVSGLSASERPFEYHLLGATPAPWEPVHTFYLLKRMGWILSFAPMELAKARVEALAGRAAADALFPARSPAQEPIVPYQGPRFLDAAIPPPEPPASASGPPSALLPGPTPRLAAGATTATTAPLQPPVGDGPSVGGSPSPEAGSNNWAVAPSRSASGNAVLAGDPHLSLSLPSLWYEVHLVVPGELDVYGVTLVGMPGVVIGFNRHVAWSFTNTGADVMDYYLERLDDPDAPSRYLLDGAWEPLETRVERFYGPDGRLLAVDTIRHTHRGPLLEPEGRQGTPDGGGGAATGGSGAPGSRGTPRGPLSLRWTVLEGQEEVAALLNAARARSTAEWLDATSGWHAPAQNGLVAGADGRIAVHSPAYYPRRPPGVGGDAVLDGTTRATDWQGRRASYPRAEDPEQGFLASANQQPVDPESDSAYLGADWPPPWRAMTINELLRAKERHSAADLEAYQTHPAGVRARPFLAAFLAAAGLRTGADSGAAGDTVTQAAAQADAAEAARLLAEWDGRYDPDNERAVLFEAAMDALEDAVWDELEDADGERAATPGSAVLRTLLAAPDSPWWDDRTTPSVEDRDALLARALAEALGQVRARHGPEVEGGWAWRNTGRHNIYHLLRIPALSRLGLPAKGGPQLLNPVSGAGTHGASWRMVVELGDTVRARGTYPGGQSGNPVSAAYDDRLGHWVRGELQELRFPRTEAELRAAGQVRGELVLVGATTGAGGNAAGVGASGSAEAAARAETRR